MTPDAAGQLATEARPPTAEHGTRARYTNGCHCPDCRAANRNYENTRTRRAAYGHPTTNLVDAAPARAHARHLRDSGLGARRIADLAGVARTTVLTLLGGRTDRGSRPTTRIHPDTAAALLAVSPDPAGYAHVDAAGTRRRLQALAAIGWSQTRLAACLGTTPGNFSTTLRRSRVHASTARRVRALYSELWDTPPPERTTAERRAASRARRRARREGWPPPAGWDDDLIDLPDGELSAELQRRAAAMDDADCSRCHRAHYVDGDLSPLIVAGAKEHGRRRHHRRRA